MRKPLHSVAYQRLLMLMLCLMLGSSISGAAARVSPPACTVQAITQSVTVALNSSGTAVVTAAQVNNGSTASCGFATGGGLSVSPSSFTCANLGPNTVTLTVTDVNGNTSAATATVTVQDLTAPVGNNVGPLPAAPATALANVPEASTYGVLYQLDVPTVAAFNTLASVPYTVNNSGLTLTGGNPLRVAYYMELTNNSTGATSWAWASMDNFASNLTQLGLPHPTNNNVTWHQSVTNLTVVASSGSGVTTGTGKTGRVEMWPTNYSQGNADAVPGASGSTYDFGDQITNSGSYGSFQVHNLTNSQTVFAYNNWGNTTSAGDIGLGSQPTASPDWTFANNAGTYSVKRIYILVPNGGNFTQNATLNLNASGLATLSTAAVYTGATDNCSGTPTVALSKTAFTCAELGANIVNVTVTDASGNAATQPATVTVRDLIAPTALAQNATVDLNAFGMTTVVASQINNGSTDNCSIASVVVSPSSFTCANLGPNTVTLTVTDNSGNVATATATVTVRDVTAPAGGILPAAPTTAMANVPEAAGYGVLYQLDIPTVAAFNTLASVPYTVNNSGIGLPAVPARVAYYMELTNNSTGVTSWAWASMDNFASNLTQLGLPHPTANNVVWHQSVTNLNVAASTGSSIVTGSAKDGRVELWPWNYSATNVDGVPGASASLFDTGDQCSFNGGHGSFQVHNLTDNQTVLAYNNFGVNRSAGDIGLGNQSTASPDWTHASNAATYSVRKLYILVPNGTGTGSFVKNATVQLPASGTLALAQNQVYTGATDNCGIASVVVSPSSFSCANLGANTVTVTVTDNSGNVASQTATVTVVDNAAPVGAGAGVLPAAPALATSNVPEASNYGIIYQLDVPTAGASFNAQTGVPYTINNSGVTMATPARVAYFMELATSSGTTSWAWASMDNFASNLTQLGLPHPTTNNLIWHQSVNNLNVAASSGSGLATGTGIGTGRLEMWYSNYSQGNSDGVPGASASTYDFGDQFATGSGYGSFQVHNVTAAQTVLAYNNWGVSSGAGDIGIGSQVGGNGNPDWTFAANAGTYSVKRIYILALNGGSFVQNATLTLNSSGAATLAQNQVYTGATDNCTVTSVVVSPTAFTCANAGVNTVQISVTDNSGNVSTQSAFVTVSAPVVPSVTWLGNSTDWNDCANWSYGRVPNATTAAIVPAGLGTYPNLTTGTFTALDLTVASGATLTQGSAATLQVYGNWANNGTASLGGTVTFMGTATNQLLGGSAATTFSTLTLNKATGTLTLQRDINVSTALTLTTGLVNTTSTYRVLLGSAATFSGETETSYLTGNIEATRTLSPAGSSSTFGGIGLTLATSAGTPTVPGVTRVIRTTGTALTGAGTSVSVKRYFDIRPVTDTGLNLTMTFNYLDVERNGILASRLDLFRSTNGTAGPFQRNYASSRNATTKVVTKTGIAALSLWTLGDGTNPLPVELTEFTAQAEGATAVHLDWATASEKNADRFEVERSTTGISFGRIATVAAHGTTNALNRYSLLDTKLPANATTLYYRLQQIDADGTASYSPVRTVRYAPGEDLAPLAVYPNPTTGLVQVSGLLAGQPVLVRDALGRIVAKATAPADGSVLSLTLPTTLPTGVYVVQSGGRSVRLAVQ